MFESNVGALERQDYTIDLTGLATHARDTLVAYAVRASARMRALRVERREPYSCHAGRHHADYHVPDCVRVR